MSAKTAVHPSRITITPVPTGLTIITVHTDHLEITILPTVRIKRILKTGMNSEEPTMVIRDHTVFLHGGVPA